MKARSFILLFILVISVILIAKYLLGIEIHKVINVIDGDTVIIETGESVRYIGIDTPESVHPNKPKECFSDEATKRNIELVLDKFVILEKDYEDIDDYGRLLRYVYTHKYFVNAQLVKEGYAYSYFYPPNLKHYEYLLNLEIQANENNRGLWQYCEP